MNFADNIHHIVNELLASILDFRRFSNFFNKGYMILSFCFSSCCKGVQWKITASYRVYSGKCNRNKQIQKQCWEVVRRYLCIASYFWNQHIALLFCKYTALLSTWLFLFCLFFNWMDTWNIFISKFWAVQILSLWLSENLRCKIFFKRKAPRDKHHEIKWVFIMLNCDCWHVIPWHNLVLSIAMDSNNQNGQFEFPVKRKLLASTICII